MLQKRAIFIFVLIFIHTILFRAYAAGGDTTSPSFAKRATLLDEVVITGINANTQFGSQISKVDFSVAPVNTAQDLMRKVPGLFIAQHQGGGKAEQIFLRGFDNDHGTDISVNFDDMPVNVVSHAHGQGYADMHFVIPELVDNIEYGKGSYYINRGDFNTSGYVNFHTFKQLPQSIVKYEQGIFDTRLNGKPYTNTLHTSGRFMAAVNAYQTQKSNAYIATEMYFSDGPFQIKQDLSRLNLFAKWNAAIDDKTRLTIQAGAFSSAWNGSGQIPERAVQDGFVNRFGSLDSTEGGSTSRANIQVSLRRNLGKHAHVENTFYYSRYKFDLWSNFTFFLEDSVNGDAINQADSRRIWGTTHKYARKYFLGNGSEITWTTGGGFRYDNVDHLFLGHIDNRELLHDSLALGQVNQTNMYAFTGTKWQSSNKKWLVQPGVRVDVFTFTYYDRLHNLGINPNQPDGNNTNFPLPTQGRGASGALAAKVSPKLNFFFDANPNTQVFLKLGMGFHSNDARSVVLYQLPSSQSLPRFYNTDLGITLRPTRGMIIQPVLWYSYLENEFVWNGDSYGVENVGTTNRHGLDITFRYQPIYWLFLDVDANWAQPTLLQSPTGDGGFNSTLEPAKQGENFVPLAPLFTSTGGVAVHLNNGLQASLRYRYMAKRPAVEDNSIQAEPYFVNNLVVTYQRTHWLARLSFENLFNVQWNQAMFATETRLKVHGKLEPHSTTDLAFTPGTPLYVKCGIQWMW